MTVPLSSDSGQHGPGLMQSRAETGLGADTGLAGNGLNTGARREDAADMATTAAFALQLAGARAAVKLSQDDENDTAVIAASPPPPVLFGLPDEGEIDVETRRNEAATLAQRLIAEVEASDRFRLGGSGPVSLTLPLQARVLGLGEARLTVAQGEVTVVFPLTRGADPDLVNAALGDLAQALAQRFPHRTIRLRSDDEGREVGDPAEFNPLKEPVGRRK